MKEKIKLLIELSYDPEDLWDIDVFDADRVIVYYKYRRKKYFYINNKLLFRVPTWKMFL